MSKNILNPFVGLKPYSEINSPFYFGREQEIENLLQILQKNKLLTLTQAYPYNLTLEYLEIDQNNSTSGNLWNAFLSDMLKRRHDIAHGREIENASSSRQIKDDRIKVEILLYAFTTFICVNSNPIIEE